MKTYPEYGTFFISGKRTEKSKIKYICTKKTLNRAIRYARKLEKKGWYYTVVMDDRSNNMMYGTHWKNKDDLF